MISLILGITINNLLRVYIFFAVVIKYLINNYNNKCLFISYKSKYEVTIYVF